MQHEAEPAPHDPCEELAELAVALRMHLLWLKEGGVREIPATVARIAPAPARSTPPPREVQTPSREALPREMPAPAPPRGPTGRPQGMEDMPSIAALLDDLSGAPRRAERPPRVDPRPPPSLDEEETTRAATRSSPASPVAGLPDPLPVFGQAGLDLVREVLGPCQRCKLCHGRNHLVFGQGHPDPLVAFVGEGPGAEEDRTGLPFVGAAGDLLNRMINAMGEEARKRGYDEIAGRLRREQVYICNVVKCRPPGNRTPEQDEVGACGPFLRAQLAALRPRIIVALGRTPTHFLLSTGAPLTRLRGRFASYQGIPVMPTYHPAYLLRTESAKRQAWDDLKMVIEELHRLMIAGAGDTPRERTT